jgi:hypothetical protein
MFAVIHEEFSNAYPDKEVLIKTTLHQLVTKFWDTESVCDKCSLNDKTAEVMSISI